MDDKDKNKAKCIVRSYTDMCTDTDVDFTIRLVLGSINKLLPKKVDYGCNLLEKTLKLYTTRVTTNMYLFDSRQRLNKYDSVYDIIDAYIPIRLELYKTRKQYMISQLKREVDILSNKARFIKEQCDDTIDLRRKKKYEVITLLLTRLYSVIDNDKDFKYLRSMRIDQLEEENIKKLQEQRNQRVRELEILRSTSPSDMWLSELETLKLQYKLYRTNRQNRQKGVAKRKVIVRKSKIKVK